VGLQIGRFEVEDLASNPVSQSHLMGWSAAFTPEQLGYKRGTKEIISWNYTRWALI
jgi:hypothetical protein